VLQGNLCRTPAPLRVTVAFPERSPVRTDQYTASVFAPPLVWLRLRSTWCRVEQTNKRRVMRPLRQSDGSNLTQATDVIGAVVVAARHILLAPDETTARFPLRHPPSDVTRAFF